MLESFIIESIKFCISLLECMGIIIIIVNAVKSFYAYIMAGFCDDTHQIKIDFARALALSLEFKMGGEILKTVITKTIDEMYVLAAVIILRAILTYIIHYEIAHKE